MTESLETKRIPCHSPGKKCSYIQSIIKLQLGHAFICILQYQFLSLSLFPSFWKRSLQNSLLSICGTASLSHSQNLKLSIVQRLRSGFLELSSLVSILALLPRLFDMGKLLNLSISLNEEIITETPFMMLL